MNIGGIGLLILSISTCLVCFYTIHWTWLPLTFPKSYRVPISLTILFPLFLQILTIASVILADTSTGYILGRIAWNFGLPTNTLISSILYTEILSVYYIIAGIIVPIDKVRWALVGIYTILFLPRYLILILSYQYFFFKSYFY